MEHAQRDPFHRFVHKIAHEVLILILMEHAQRVYASDWGYRSHYCGLNPYFNGTCSKSILQLL